MSKIWNNLFGGPTAAQAAPGKFNAALAAIGSAKQADDSHYDAIVQSYAANLGNSMHKSIAALQNGSVLGHANALKQHLPPASPEPKDVPALAISLDAAYDLWAAKHGYEWVNINAALSDNDVNRLYQHQRYAMGWQSGPLHVGTPTGTYTVTAAPVPPEPEFDWYTVARRLVHVRALENEGGYYRLVPKEWFK